MADALTAVLLSLIDGNQLKQFFFLTEVTKAMLSVWNIYRYMRYPIGNRSRAENRELSKRVDSWNPA
jgi:hypothetical protein